MVMRTPRSYRSRSVAHFPSPGLCPCRSRRGQVDFPKADNASRGLVGRDGWKTDFEGRGRNGANDSKRISCFNQRLQRVDWFSASRRKLDAVSGSARFAG